MRNEQIELTILDPSAFLSPLHAQKSSGSRLEQLRVNDHAQFRVHP